MPAVRSLVSAASLLLLVSACAGGAGPTGDPGPKGDTGPAGPAGAVGPVGVAGPAGATGPAGALGPAGPKGDTGAKGADGAAGQTGPAGSAGPAGASVTGLSLPIGNTKCPAGGTQFTLGVLTTYACNGAAGAQGLQGALGAAGPQGADGLTGPQGTTGPAGPAGAQGAIGLTGPAGAQGAMGLTGPPGSQGVAGPTGPTGATGAVGATGLTGATGAVGPQGPTGNTGVTGATGAAGSNSLWTVNGTAMSYSGGNIGIGTGTSTPSGLLQVAGPIRMGSEKGTAEGPGNYQGMVVRRALSTSVAKGNVVARTAVMTLERDGTNGGFQVTWPANGPAIITVNGTAMNTSGTTTGIHFETFNQFSGGTAAVEKDTDNIVYLHLVFGNVYNREDLTEVTLMRSSAFLYSTANGNDWVGTISSSYDQ